MTSREHEAAIRFYVSAGKDVAMRSVPNYWRYEDHSRAEPYAAMLPALRRHYVELRDARSTLAAIKAVERAKAVVKTGIEYNKLRLALDCLKGDDEVIKRSEDE